MGRHSGNITRALCGAITCVISVCLLTCAFINTAYADSDDLPIANGDQYGGQYNPEGTLFGTTALVFTDAWEPYQSIFSQSLSSAFQVVQDKTTIYTAIVADLVRQSNNQTRRANLLLNNISSKFDTLLNDTGSLLTELKFNSYSVNGSSYTTIRGLVKEVSDSMVVNNATLQQIKDEFRNSNNLSYLSSITSNTSHISDIWTQLSNSQSGTLRNVVNSVYTYTQYIKSNTDDLVSSALNIDSKITTLNGYLSRIETAIGSYLGSGGYIGQQLNLIATDVRNIYNILSSTRHYFTANGVDYYYFRSLPVDPTDNSSVYSYVRDLFSELSQIKTALSDLEIYDYTTILNNINANINSYLSSSSPIYQILSTINGNIADVKTILQSTRHYFTANGVDYYYFRSLPVDPTDNSSVYSYVRDLFSELSQIKTALSDLDINDYTTILNNINANINSYLSSSSPIYQILSTINGNIADVKTILQSTRHYFTANGVDYYYFRSLPVDPTDNSSVYSYVRDLFSELSQIRTSIGNLQIPDYSTVLNNIATNIVDIKTLLQSARHYFTGSNGQEYYYFRTLLVDPTNSSVFGLIRNINTALQGIDAIVANNEAYHEELIAKLQQILLKLSVPNDAEDLIGDFDKDLFDDNVSDLIETVSTLAPFGAILVASMELSILTQVDPIQKPELVIPFNFSGDNGNVTLDLSWLDNALPLFHFVIEFLFILMLLNVTMKYVRQEATS